MFHTARTSARTMLVAAGAAGFVALGAGIAGADTLGGVTDGLPLGDLGSQVPTALTEGVGTPVGDLIQVEPGDISAQPDVRHQSGSPTDAIGHVVGDGVSAQAPVETGKDNSTGVGPLDLGETTESLPLNGAGETLPLSGGSISPVSSLVDALSRVGGGDILPMSDADTKLPYVGDTVTELGDGVGRGVQDTSSHLTGTDTPDLSQVGDVVPMSGPVGLDAGENADLTGGITTLLPSDVDETLPMSGSGDIDVAGVADTVGSLVESGPGSVVPVEGETLPLADGTTDLLPSDVGGDLVGVQGLPELGEPEIGGEPAVLPEATEATGVGGVTDALPGDLNLLEGLGLPLL